MEEQLSRLSVAAVLHKRIFGLSERDFRCASESGAPSYAGPLDMGRNREITIDVL
jgi:hypothetical protein